MRVWTVVLLFAAVTVAGCQRGNTPPPAQETPQVTVLSLGGYTFECEQVGQGQSKVEGHRKEDGKEALDEDITITCGPQTARIVNGTLTAGGKDRGAVKPGDRIKLTSAGKVFVNQAER